MARSTPVRTSYTSTADLLTWTERQEGNPADVTPSLRTRIRTLPSQKGGGIKTVLFGGETTDEDADSLFRRKQCSGSKWKEMTGSGIFVESNKNESTKSEASPNRVAPRQVPNAVSQISFSSEESVPLKKPTTIPEVAKQRELSGTLQRESDSKLKKQVSVAKTKELSGNDIFGPPPEIVSRPLAARILEKEKKDISEPAVRAIHTSVKVSNPAGGQSNIMFGDEPVIMTARKIHNQKFAELSGNNIFQGGAMQSSAEKSLSNAKLREISGNNIFADGKSGTREYYGGVRKPPGGESSLALV